MNKYITGVIAMALLSTATVASAYPGHVIIGFSGGSTEIVDEGTIYADELAELNMAGVSNVSVTIKVTSDRGRVYEAQIADGTDCTLQYDAAGKVEAVECQLDD